MFSALCSGRQAACLISPLPPRTPALLPLNLLTLTTNYHVQPPSRSSTHSALCPPSHSLQELNTLSAVLRAPSSTRPLVLVPTCVTFSPSHSLQEFNTLSVESRAPSCMFVFTLVPSTPELLPLRPPVHLNLPIYTGVQHAQRCVPGAQQHVCREAGLPPCRRRARGAGCCCR